MGTIYLMRHGETEYHAQKRVLGRIDAGLNQRGKEQALLAAGYFEGIELAAIYSSPLRRCRETAQPVAEMKGMAIETVEGLMEVDMGEWDGQLLKDLFEQDSERVGKWMQSPSSVPIPGGEDFGTVKERVIGAAGEITSGHSGDEKILIVSHGGPIRGIISEALRLDLDNMFRIQIDLTSISAIKYFGEGIQDTAVITLLNNTCHLADLEG
jgi:broad specificity phosphatase PhoE